MKKIILLSSIALVGLLSACDDDYSNQFNIDAPITDVKNSTFTLLSSDYPEVAGLAENQELALSKDPETGVFVEALNAVGTNKYFTDNAPAEEYLPAYLNKKFPNADLGSKFTVTFNQYQAPAAYLADFTNLSVYDLTDRDYKAVWGSNLDASYLSPSTLNKIPALLSENVKDAAAGDMKVVNYAYSDTEPSTGGNASVVYQQTDQFDGEGVYVIAAKAGDGKYYPFGKLKAESYTYGYMYPAPIIVTDGIITEGDGAAYTVSVEETTGGYALKNTWEQYLYMAGTYNSFNVSTALPSEGGVWKFNKNADGTYSIVNVLTEKTVKLNLYNNSYSYGAYPSTSFEGKIYLSAVSLLGSKAWGEKAFIGSDYTSYTYFLSVAKRFNDSHQLTLTAFGSPQTHYQRKGALTIAGWEYVEKVYGVKNYRYNSTYGFDNNGQRKTSEYNEYHKPQISLNHQWNINEKSSLSTVAYVSIGRGNGYSGQGNEDYGYSYTDWRGANYGSLINTYRKPDGTFDYGAIQDLNAKSEYGSMLVMTKSKNNHNWYGLISTYTTKIGENIDFYGGVDFRYYKGTHTNEINDLYDGKYFIDSTRGKVSASNNRMASDPAWRYQKLGVGDVVYRDYDGHVLQEGAFFQAEYSKDKLTAFLSGALSNTGYWRYDRFYYDKEHAKSETINFIGFNVKGGANFNLSENHNVFANLGYISRAPKFSYGAFMTSTTSNVINKDAKNEKVFMVDLGYGFKSSWLTANVTAYYTKCRSLPVSIASIMFPNIRHSFHRYIIRNKTIFFSHTSRQIDLSLERS
jgi:hypothetical protein